MTSTPSSLALEARARMTSGDLTATLYRLDAACDRLEQLPFVGREIAAGLVLEERKNIDHLPGRDEIDGSRLGGAGLEPVAEVDGGRRSERQYERREVDVRIRHKTRMLALLDG